jgi:hypothetical protein
MPLNKPSSKILNAGSFSNPQNLAGAASPGIGPDYSFADHAHKLPTPGEIGALSTDQIAGLSSSAPAALASVASAGNSTSAARADHVHAFPTASQVGAVATTDKAAVNGVASLDENARLSGAQMPAVSGDVVINAGQTTATVNKIKGISVNTPTVSGTIAQFDGTSIVWGTTTTGGGGGGSGGLSMFFNNGTNADNPITGMPALTNSAVYKEFKRTAETNQTTLTSAALTSSYTNIAGFITDIDEPGTVAITAGLWNFNLWAVSSNGDSLIKASLYKYSGSVASLLATSTVVTVPSSATQLTFSLTVPQTSISITDRIAVVFEASNPGSNNTVTLQFGGSTPSYANTTLPPVGKTGVMKVINGVLQSIASPITNSDIAANAEIEQSKISGLSTSLAGLSTSLASKVGTGDTIAIAKGGTGQTTKSAAFDALSPIAAAGDLIIGSGVNTATTLAIGTSGKVLTSNGATATWETPTGGGGGTDAGLGNAIFPVSVRQVANMTPAANTSATILTYAAGAGIGGTSVIDGYTLAQNDVVLFTNQTTLHQMGPWVITTLGTSSVAAVLTRPSWFSTDTAKSGTLCLVQYGATSTGFIMSLSGPLTTTNGTINIGTSTITVSQIWGRSTIATAGGANLFTAHQTFRANGTASNQAPFFFQPSGGLMTVPQPHAIEWDSTNMYSTNSAFVRKKFAYTDSSTLVNTTLQGFKEEVTTATVGGSYTLNIASATFFTLTLTSATACTFTMPIAVAGKSFTVCVRQPTGGTASLAVTFTGVKWPDNTAPIITSTLGRCDLFVFISDGVRWYGSASQNFTY